MELLEIGNRPKKNLSYKHQRFVDEYMIDGDSIKAALRAGYCDPEVDYKDHKASAKLRQTVYQLNHNIHIQEEITRRRQEISTKSIMNAEEILEMYTKIARGEVLDQFGIEASLKDRITALNELSKRMIDLKPVKEVDNTLTIKLVRD